MKPGDISWTIYRYIMFLLSPSKDDKQLLLPYILEKGINLYIFV